MLQAFLKRNPGVWVVLQHPGDQVQHHGLLLALYGGRPAAAVLRQRPAVLGRVLGRREAPVPGQPPTLEVGGLAPPDDVVGDVPEDPTHHGQVLQVVVGLEQRVTLKKFTYYCFF